MRLSLQKVAVGVWALRVRLSDLATRHLLHSRRRINVEFSAGWCGVSCPPLYRNKDGVFRVQSIGASSHISSPTLL